jgi:hypothetical protein
MNLACTRAGVWTGKMSVLNSRVGVMRKTIRTTAFVAVFSILAAVYAHAAFFAF